jgi:tripartite ATP-independent transporter DctM subunit
MAMADTLLAPRRTLPVFTLTRVLATIGVIAIIGGAFLTLLDVGLRALAGTTIRGLNEILILCVGVAIAACLPSGAARAVHLTLDLMTARLRPMPARALALFGTIALMLFLLLVGIELFQLAQTLNGRGQATIILHWPVAPFHYAMSALVLLCVPVQALHVVSALVRIWREGAGAGRLVELLPALALLALAALVVSGSLAWMPGHGWLRGLTAGVAALVFFGAMWAAMLIGVPLSAAMGLVGFLGIATLLAPGPAGTVVGGETSRFLTSETLAVLPLFLLMGSFASVAGLSADIYRFAHELLRPLRGSLAHATIAGCAGFGALTGSSLATAATFGRVALPEMEARGYDPALAAGSVAAGGTLGSLVPPSTALILFALLSEQSIGALFVASIVPAMLAIGLYLGAIRLMLALRPGLAPEGSAIDGPALMTAAKRCTGAVILFGAVIGGMYTGIVTDTEAASVGAVGAFLFALIRGQLGGGKLWSVMAETTTTIALIYTLIFGAVIFSFLIAFTQLPALLSGWIVGMDLSPLAVVLMLVAIYLVLGMVMDSYAMMVITVPIFLPLILHYGYDPIWWGVLTVICVEMGMITPPFGMNIFMLRAISANLPLGTIYRGVLPFVAVDLLKVAIVILFPALALWLPAHM